MSDPLKKSQSTNTSSKFKTPFEYAGKTAKHGYIGKASIAKPKRPYLLPHLGNAVGGASTSAVAAPPIPEPAHAPKVVSDPIRVTEVPRVPWESFAGACLIAALVVVVLGWGRGRSQRASRSGGQGPSHRRF